MSVLESIFKIENAKLKAHQLDIVAQTVSLKPDNLIAGRLATLILDLFSRVSTDKFNQTNYEQALELLIRCEKQFVNSGNSFGNLIQMARLSFELGMVADAKRYTDQAKLIQPNHIYVFLNQGWFALLQNDHYTLARAYSRIFETGFTIEVNAVELLEFFSRHRPQYSNVQLLFDFVEGFTYKLSAINVEMGNEILRDLAPQLKTGQMIELFLLANRALNLGERGVDKRANPKKSSNFNRKKRKKKRK
ncbi:MAG: hypothetical protein JKY46_01135 [Robiginitomaculum sp.]|nr:hypothetical protein [Robiginitomaculum sp.]